MVSISFILLAKRSSDQRSDPVESEIDDIEMDEIESSFEPATQDETMDELAH